MVDQPGLCRRSARPTSRPRAAAAVLALAAAVLLGGCGGGTEEEPDVAPSPAPASTDTQGTEPTSPSPTELEPTEPEPTEPTEPTEPVEPTESEPTTAEPSITPTPTAEPPAPSGDLPTTYDDAAAAVDALGPPVRARGFETDAGTYCLLDDAFVTGCELLQGVPDPEFCGTDGPVRAVGRVLFGPGGPEAECNSDTVREGPGRPIAADSVVRWPATGIRCAVFADDDVVCLDDAARTGFALAPGGYRLF